MHCDAAASSCAGVKPTRATGARTIVSLSLPKDGHSGAASCWTAGAMAPAVQHDAAPEWPSFGSDNDTIVLAPVARVGFTPAQLEAAESQCIKGNQQVFRPLVTVAAFLQTMIDQEIVKDRRAEHAVLSPELADGRVSTIREQLCFIAIHLWRKCSELIGQRFRLGRIAARHLE